jgi:condensin complex subunit 3
LNIAVIELIDLSFYDFFEVASFHMKKTAAERSYVSALCRILILLHFRLSEQGSIKLMRRLLSHVAGSVLAEKDLVKELERMAEHLKALDREPDQELLQDQANLILGKTFTFLWKGKGGTVLF